MWRNKDESAMFAIECLKNNIVYFFKLTCIGNMIIISVNIYKLDTSKINQYTL